MIVHALLPFSSIEDDDLKASFICKARVHGALQAHISVYMSADGMSIPFFDTKIRACERMRELLATSSDA